MEKICFSLRGPLRKHWKNLPTSGGRSADGCREVKQIEVFIPTREGIDQSKRKVVLPLHINKRIESASLGGTAHEIFLVPLAPPNAASGWGDSGFKRKC